MRRKQLLCDVLRKEERPVTTERARVGLTPIQGRGTMPSKEEGQGSFGNWTVGCEGSYCP